MKTMASLLRRHCFRSLSTPSTSVQWVNKTQSARVISGYIWDRRNYVGFVLSSYTFNIWSRILWKKIHVLNVLLTKKF